MRNLVFVVIWLVGAAVAYGYFDANNVHSSKERLEVSMQVVDAQNLYFDTMDYLNAADRDALHAFIKVSWTKPQNEIVSSIFVSGTVKDGKTGLESFSGYCARGSSTNLRPGVWVMEGRIPNDDPVCFLKLKMNFPVKHLANGEADMDWVIATRDQINQLAIDNPQSDVKVVNKPLRYVVWMEVKRHQVWDWLSYPFTRSG